MEDCSRASDHTDNFGPIIAAYGAPDRDDSTATDNPRPPIPTRIIEYRPENVEIIFYPDVTFGDPPPYNRWKVVGYIDLTTNTKISATDATLRLQGRSTNR